jgi:hypothetical protein
VGRAEQTGLDGGAYDAVMLRHVLAHNGTTAQQIVDHVAGLVRAGGGVLLVDVDATAMRMRPDDPVVQELMGRYVAFQEARGGDVRIGLRLDLLIEGAGLELVAYRGLYDIVTVAAGMRGPAWAAREAMLEAGTVTQEELDRWGEHFREREAASVQVTLFVPRFVAVGQRAG